MYDEERRPASQEDDSFWKELSSIEAYLNLEEEQPAEPTVPVHPHNQYQRVAERCRERAAQPGPCPVRQEPRQVRPHPQADPRMSGKNAGRPVESRWQQPSPMDREVPAPRKPSAAGLVALILLNLLELSVILGVAMHWYLWIH